MADHTDTFKPIPQQLDSRQSIVLQILGRAENHIAGRFPEPPVIVPQRGDPRPRESIRDDSERLVTEQFLVPVLETAARDHDKHRSLSVTIRRHCQCSFQHSVPIGERHLLGSVRERPDRSLWPPEHRSARRKRHRKRHPTLGESPDNRLPEINPLE